MIDDNYHNNLKNIKLWKQYNQFIKERISEYGTSQKLL